ncbi:glycoside hydrolase family 27 protein [Exidia glandulosa HHB12029]|uniref:Alpha-galactosidase n=1 Tax=Exidia glandulosa HHB12029 TaxID=1314781 RepID=A0A165QDQ3_EXIGL|nr:glycoside hydrolase family 27 protein [Exidia glandulosa HHB12029]
MRSAGSALAVAILLIARRVSALDNGVARLPVLGYNAWNAFQCNVDEDLILQTANQMVALGLKDAGYNFINLDDCWALKNRSDTGDLVPDPAKFPDGISGLVTKLAALGFKTGIYSDSGWFTCAGYPGSWANEKRDLELFNEWGISLLKYDNCNIPFDNITRQNEIGRYQVMQKAIADVAEESGKPPIIFSLCEWGWQQVWLWGKTIGQSWRTTGDISPQWSSLASIINFNSFITMATDFYGRNDMDMLQLGNGDLTIDEAKAHFTAWALMKSTLLIGTDMRNVSQDVVDILTNSEILAINQDPVVGTSISPFRWGFNPDWTSDSLHPAQYWSGPTQDGVVFMLVNVADSPATLSFNLTESPWIRAGRQYSVRDLWSHTDEGIAVRSFSRDDVPPHGVVALLLKDAGDEPDALMPQCAVWYQCVTQDGIHVGG